MKWMIAILLFILSGPISLAQSWSGILVSSRAIDWTKAGLPATLPNGETTPNPWTPPTRSQCTLYSGFPAAIAGTGVAATDIAVINNALTACSGSKGYIPVTGTFSIGGNVNNCFSGGASCIQFYSVNGATLRGSNGAQSAKLVLTGNGEIAWGIAWSTGSCTWTSGFSAGTTSITMNSCSGPTLVPGELIALSQCDSGFTGAGCTTGTSTDNGGLYICGDNTACVYAGEGTGGPQSHQQQTVYVNSVTNNGGGSFTVTFTPGIYMPNWSSASSPFVTWTTTTSAGNNAYFYGDGLEDLTVDMTGTAVSDTPIQFSQTYASWIKGVRFVGIGPNFAVRMGTTKNCLFANNYLYSDALSSGTVEILMGQGGDSDDLNINNIYTGGIGWEGTGSTEGNVFAFNYFANGHSTYYDNTFFEHVAGSAFQLYEGNDTGSTEDDATHGTHDLNTWFRNFISGWDAPLNTANARGLFWDSFARFENGVGNSIGGPKLTNYQSTPSSVQSAFEFGVGAGLTLFINDPLVGTSALRWGNCDQVTATCRFQSSEIPTGLTGNAAPFNNTVPSTHNLPCSFFLSTYTATTCTPKLSGGTGLSFWSVCVSPASFPYVSCTTTKTQPFPIAGPDITLGSYVNGTAYDNPAAIAFLNLPLADPAYQNSYSIASSSWSAGVETLTFNTGVLPAGIHTVGGFQISGAPACNSAAGTEFLVLNDPTATTIQYALAANPGSCAGGNFLFPDVRKFDERVYISDTTIPQASTPRFSLAAGTYLTSQSVTITTISVGAIICYNTTGSPATNGSTGCSTGTLYTGPVTVSASEHLYAVAGGTGYTDSTIASIAYAIGPTQIMPQIFAGNSMTSGSATVTGN